RNIFRAHLLTEFSGSHHILTQIGIVNGAGRQAKARVGRIVAAGRTRQRVGAQNEGFRLIDVLVRAGNIVGVRDGVAPRNQVRFQRWRWAQSVDRAVDIVVTVIRFGRHLNGVDLGTHAYV